MKKTKSLVAAFVFATASLGSGVALAQADISQPPEALTLLDGSGFFGDSFAMDNMGDTFSDHFTFSVTELPHNIDAIISSISSSASTGLDITGLSVYSEAGTLIANGTSLMTGMNDVWTLSTDNLALGNYYLQVSGAMVSDTSGSFGGAVMLVPVPEPETYGMMLAGLGLVGWMARRRQKTAA
ncbi:PEP-CTERM sorting domain-containing protein [Massilia sp. RP-1-19]|uniref:PEP-CTERM sorting domain-containing protein n=1 Tax=Massilia polaris TaxID=2728846 RepID=A0A848HI83_9BURK|nr:FxDxF family PEP-CTERM protein [Massilia polaris]NML60924.1 PEP-CTERM sorting domain-containing protein [Massilia polaris]